ncbi:hypothetical protein CIB95_12655 [Lottiidibacillus patelloidae]|uniref:Uncharacterized protein n=1 Tax=Lottiidibacillus patelloidae TaxID=2670334 RepID=A0A263BRR8_9BACI|nr:hypothetical protein [Lottiidibacillus patelloidae]OZM56268.1 hypothetical protein CIB95_12655 [Lottiidibacillus patelloidae]
MNLFIYIIFILLYGLVTLYGVGPLLLADGSSEEKLILLLVVSLIYILLTFVFVKWLKKRKHLINWVVYTILGLLVIFASYLSLGTLFISERPFDEKVITIVVSIFLYIIAGATYYLWNRNK